jgi:hypothetical protein
LRVQPVNASSHSIPVQRLFSMFPQGGPGVALLLLRLSVAGTFFLNASALFPSNAGHWPAVCAIFVSFFLSLGFLTPAFSVLACTAAFVRIWAGPHFYEMFPFSSLLDAAAMGLLGPGAYSLDARLFGRRIVVIPPRGDGTER